MVSELKSAYLSTRILGDWTGRLSLQPPPLRGEGWRGGTSHSDPVTTLPTGTTARLQSDTPPPEPSLAIITASRNRRNGDPHAPKSSGCEVKVRRIVRDLSREAVQRILVAGRR